MALARRLANEKTALFTRVSQRPRTDQASQYSVPTPVLPTYRHPKVSRLSFPVRGWANRFSLESVRSVSFLFAAGADLMTPVMKSLPFDERARHAASLDLFAPVHLARRFADWRLGKRDETANDSVLFFSWDGAARGMEGETAPRFDEGGLAAFARSFCPRFGETGVLTIAAGWIATTWGHRASAKAKACLSRVVPGAGGPRKLPTWPPYLISGGPYLNGVEIPSMAGFV